MKKLLFFTSILVASLLTVGCGPKSQSMYRASVNKQHKANVASLNKQSGDIQDINHLKQHAVTKDQQFYFNLLNSYIKDPKLVMGKKMDPATDPEAQAIAESAFQIGKKEIIKAGQMNGQDRSVAIKTVKVLEADKNSVFYLLNPTPDGSQMATVKSMGEATAAYYNDIPTVYFQFDTPTNADAKMAELIDAFKFMDHDKSWSRTENMVANVYKRVIATYKDLLAAHRQAYQENENINHNSPLYKQRKTQLEMDISKAENTIKGYERSYNKMEAGEIKQLMYTYRWKGKNKYGMNQYVIAINNKEDYVGVNISKLDGK